MHRGLTEKEHLHAVRLLHRAYSGLRGMLRILRSRYSPTHRAKIDLNRAMNSVRMARILLEDEAHREHPQARIRYVVTDTAVHPSIERQALASAGDDVGVD